MREACDATAGRASDDLDWANSLHKAFTDSGGLGTQPCGNTTVRSIRSRALVEPAT